MKENVKTPIDVVGLREQLSVLKLDELKEKFEELGIADHWKNGMNKQSLVEKGISAYVELKNQEEESPLEERDLTVEIPEGEYEIDSETLDEYPELAKLGFSIGDILVHEEGKPFYKKVVTVENLEVQNPVVVTEEEKLTQVIEEEEETTTKLNEDGEEFIQEYVPEVIDETLYTEEEILENIEICQANCHQALPDTRLTLLRKIDALKLALERKSK